MTGHGTTLHAAGFDGFGDTLCGFVEDRDPGEVSQDAPKIATSRQTVTCPTCQQIILHVYRSFSASFRVRWRPYGHQRTLTPPETARGFRLFDALIEEDDDEA